MKKQILLLLFLSSLVCYGQVQTYYIKPNQTDSNYAAMEDSSAISINSNTKVNKLFLFLGGTKSSSSKDYNALRLHAANLGFDFINLSYPNSVAAASLKNNADSLAFNKYRQELCFGTPESDEVVVDSFNSIYTRTLKLLEYLKAAKPSQNWGQYLTETNTILWSKIIIGGHSQGAGHAAYLAKRFRVERALMFSGPNDYSDKYSNSANWLRQVGKTPILNHFAYLSLKDEAVDFSKQFSNLSGLGMLEKDDSTYVDNITSPYTNSHFLYTTQKPGIVILNHNVPIKLSTINNEVWTYLLTTSLSTDVSENDMELGITWYPNPTTSILRINSRNGLNGKTFILRNINGQMITSNQFQNAHVNSIDFTGLESGIYYLSMDNQTLKIIKQ